MGIFGNESGFGIASVGVIVFDADRCRDGIIPPSELDIEDQDDSESSATTQGDMSEDKNQFTDFEKED